MPQLTIQQIFTQALQHHQAGRLHEAQQHYQQILAEQPEHAGALHFLGLLAYQAGQTDVAVDLIQRAIALNPNWPQAQVNLGSVLQAKGQWDEAIAAFGRGIALQPNYAIAYYNLGNAWQAKGCLDEAIAAFRHAIALKPDYHEAYSNLGIALSDSGCLDQAVAACRQAIALNPGYALAYNNLGIALQNQGHLDQAITTFRQAIALQPNVADAHLSLAVALLGHGELTEGWAEYEWRWQSRHSPVRPNYVQPQWDGGALQGRTLLLHAEQGFGDTLQFIRYLPLVAARGGRVIVECPPELLRLLQPMAPTIAFVARGQVVGDFDWRCSLMSLPQVLGTTPTTIPHDVPYLHAHAADTEIWRKRLAAPSALLKVGLAWAGSRAHKNDRHRSLPLASLAPLAQVSGVRFYSLQKGASATEATPPPGMELIDMSPELQDFADTAGLIANLDLVIAVDTAVAHLAGAMGKPVWTLLPFNPDWRWLREREDSPWYPTMRLFRQPAIGDWDSVIQQVSKALASMVQRG